MIGKAIRASSLLLWLLVVMSALDEALDLLDQSVPGDPLEDALDLVADVGVDGPNLPAEANLEQELDAAANEMAGPAPSAPPAKKPKLGFDKNSTVHDQRNMNSRFVCDNTSSMSDRMGHESHDIDYHMHCFGLEFL